RGFDTPYPCARIELPTYPWQRRRYWLDVSFTDDPVAADSHPLLRHQVTTPTGGVYETMVSPETFPFLDDHRLAGQVVLPGMAYIEMAWALADQLFGDGPHTVEDVVFRSALRLRDRERRRLHVNVVRDGPDAARFEVFSQAGESWEQHVSGTLRAAATVPAAVDRAAVEARCPDLRDVEQAYAQVGTLGLSLGPALQGVERLGVGAGEMFAEVVLRADEPHRFGAHPAQLDAIIQPMLLGLQSNALYIPFSLSGMVLFQPLPERVWVHYEQTVDGEVVSARVQVYTPTGEAVARFDSVQIKKVDAALLRPAGTDQWLYHLAWRAAPVSAGRLEGRWLLVGEAASLAALWRAHGAEVVTAAPEDFVRVLAEAGDLRGVICEWSSPAADEPLLETEARLCGGTLHLALALKDRPAPLWLVTRGAWSVTGEVPVPAAAPIWGLGRAIMQELPDLHCHLVDLDGPAREDLLAEVSAADSETQVAWRAGQRYVARLVRAQAPPPGPAIRADASYLVTGGLGALGRLVVASLVARGARHVVITSRRDPGEEERAWLASQGATIEVSRSTDLRALVASLAHPLRGVVHCAGVLRDGMLAQQRWEDFEAVLAPKAAGAWALHEATQDLALDFFVLFSSAASLWWNAGQANYAAANAFLDSLAEYRQARGLPAVSINWGPWASGGMAANLQASHRQRLATQGLELIEAGPGMRVLEMVAGRGGAIAVLPVDWKAMRTWLGSTVPTWLSEVMPGTAAPRKAATFSNLLNRLEATAPDQRRPIVIQAVQAQLARVLGLQSASDVGTSRPLKELGLDSLMAVELRNGLAAVVGRSLPATLAYDYPTVEAMADYLLGQLALAKPTAPRAIAAQVRTDHEPIAVIGIGCRYPGGIHDAESFWAAISQGVDAITEVPADRWDANAVYDPEAGKPGMSNTRWGGFLDGIDRFDAPFFSIPPREAATMDPQQRILLEVAWAALEHAGCPPDRLTGSQTGVFLGLMLEEYGNLQNWRGVDAWSGLGSLPSVASGRLSYLLGLQGPSLTLDTACSSSLVAVHLAMASLRSGESDLALAGGVTVVLTPWLDVYFSQVRGLAADGRCKTFDASADGVVWSDGCGVLVLKRLSDAQRDGDAVLAVLQGSAVNQDGRSNGLTAPNGPSQEAVIRTALANARVSPDEVDYVEAHGTGTPLGDPIEVQALAAVLGEGRATDRPVLLSAVKSNLGHTMAAAGVAGIIKAVLALQHEAIPPSLHFEHPSPHIPWDDLPVRVVTQLTPWPSSSRRRVVGVSSFGISGTNAHVVVEEAPTTAEAETVSSPSVHFLPLSARDPQSLKALAGLWASHLSTHPGLRLRDVCHVAGRGRSHLSHRLALLAETPTGAAAALLSFAAGSDVPGLQSGTAPGSGPSVAFLFTGQGSQYVGMGRSLYDAWPVFRATLDRCAAILQPLLPRPLLSVMFGDASDDAIHQTQYTQPALVALEVALADLWRSWGIQPVAVLGHSIG
ncbi:MAG TPA: beta-ketoacyl synthase N-terminal-like domain-containing protein, partial [Candidatus Xenobia bacterium]